ncbi:MAG TPA: hypothetical protein VLX67_09850 [Stellaceae bacterium]|nr:hypothetical protein [Stellaceae bacterium]
MSDGPFVPYVVILSSGPLSPAEDLETAVIAAAQEQSLGQLALRIEHGGEVILQENELKEAVDKRLTSDRDGL